MHRRCNFDMTEIAIKENVENLPEKRSHLFRPYYCWRYDDGTLRDFWRSRIQVAMCHDFNKNDPHIIEVDLRPDLSGDEPKFWGVFRKDGEIDFVYPHKTLTNMCGGPKDRMHPVEVVVLDEVATVAEQLEVPPLTIELKPEE